MKPVKIIILVSITLVLLVTSSEAGWLIYHKPAFKGKVIDAETKEPIDGAVVVVTYYKHIFRFMPESGSVVIDVKETLTDKEGNFRIPSYTTLIDPLAWESWASFIIFKPGYGNYPNYQVSPQKVGVDPEDFFSKEKIGTKGVMEWKGMGKKYDVIFGVVELPKLMTREERILTKPTPVGEPRDWKKQKMFIKAIRDEWQYLYGEDPGKLYNIEGGD